jgi:hypothetical protein
VSDHFGVEVPMPSNILLLSKWKLVLFDKPVALDQNATLFVAPPERPATHEPLTSRKQPPVSWIPFAKVEVAAVPVTLRYVVCIPAEYEEVALAVTLSTPVTARFVVVAFVVVLTFIVKPLIVEDAACTMIPIVVVGTRDPPDTFQSLKAVGV